VEFHYVLLTKRFYFARFGKDQLMNFILSVRRSYHVIPYHNWDHGLCVAHTIYGILKNSQGMFSELEVYLCALYGKEVGRKADEIRRNSVTYLTYACCG